MITFQTRILDSHNTDKIFHFVEFLVLGILVQFSLHEREISSQKAVVFMTIIFGFSIACIDELHQSFIRGRVCSVEDLLFDFLGISLSIFNYKNFFLTFLIFLFTFTILLVLGLVSNEIHPVPFCVQLGSSV